MVRGQACIGQRCGLHGVQISERQQPMGVANQHVGRHPTVLSQARRHGGEFGLTLAVVLHPLYTTVATAAAGGSVEGDRLPDLEPGDPCSECFDPAGVLVAQRERRFEGNHSCFEVVDQVEVGMAHPGATHLQQDLAGARIWLGHITDFRIVLPLGELNCIHGWLPRVGFDLTPDNHVGRHPNRGSSGTATGRVGAVGQSVRIDGRRGRGVAV